MIISPLAVQHDDTPRDTKDQKLPAKTIVVHITGRQTYLNAVRKKIPCLIQIGEYFDEGGHPFAHYTVDPWGRILCHAPETETPWAQGWKKHGGRKGVMKKKAPKWWLRAWEEHGFNHPVDLLIVGQETPNDRSSTIEFIQYGNQFLLTYAQYVMGNALIRDISARNGIPLMRPYVLGHEDVDPWGRGKNESGGWDPGQWRTHGAPRFRMEYLLDPTRIEVRGRSIIDTHTVLPTPDMPEWEEMPKWRFPV